MRNVRRSNNVVPINFVKNNNWIRTKRLLVFYSTKLENRTKTAKLKRSAVRLLTSDDEPPVLLTRQIPSSSYRTRFPYNLYKKRTRKHVTRYVEVRYDDLTSFSFILGHSRAGTYGINAASEPTETTAPFPNLVLDTDRNTSPGLSFAS